MENLHENMEVPAQGKNSAAIMNGVRIGVGVIVVAAVGYSEIMFLGIIQSMFPDGLLRIGAIVGGVATGLSVLALIAGKLGWFTPGGQTVAAWIFTGIETIILILNDILAFGLHSGALDPNLKLWYSFCPAVPVISIVGWVIVLFLDERQRERDAYAEMASDMNKSKREYAQLAFNSRMALRRKYMAQVTEYMHQALASASAQEQVQHAARLFVADVLSDATGIESRGQIAAPQQIRRTDSRPLATEREQEI